MKPWRFINRFLKSDSRRFKHDSLFELYGAKLPSSNGTNTNMTEKNNDDHVDSCSTALKDFAAAQYKNPNHISPSIRSAALEKLYLLARCHQTLRIRDNKDMTRRAQDVFASSSSYSSWAEHFHYGFVLYRQGEFEKCCSHVSLSLKATVDEASLSSADFSAVLKCAALYMLSAERIGVLIDLEKMGIIKTALSSGAKIIKVGTEIEKKTALTAMNIFWWSMDWVFQSERLLSVSKLNFRISEWEPFLPYRMKKHIFVIGSHAEMDEIRSVRTSTPWAIHIRIQKTHSGDALRRLLHVVISEESSNPDFCIFDLAVEIATKMVKLQPDVKFSKYALNVLGTALSPLCIASFGNTRETHEKAILLVSQMSGFRAYHAMRQLLFHRNSTEQRLLQETVGDIFFDASSPGQNWIEALSMLQSEIQECKANWRSNLPHVLRLLSDAGKWDTYFELLLDYNATENKRQNLCVASSLAQAVRRSGTWWRAAEVLNLISLSDAPKDECHDMFLHDACIQVLYGLRSARKWVEALSFFLPLQSVIPEQGFRWMCSMVSDLPRGAPWQKVLSLLESHKPVPEKFLASLKCIHLGEGLPTEPRDLNFVLNSLVQQGSWSIVMKEALKNSDIFLWKYVLQSAMKSCDPIPPSFFSEFPEGVLCSSECGRLGFIVAQEHGMLPEYLKAVKNCKEASFEYAHIAHLLVHNSHDCFADYCFRSKTCIRYCVDLLCKSRKTIRLLAEQNNETTETVANYFDIPQSRCREQVCNTNQKVFLLNTPEGSELDSDLVVFNGSSIILAYKPYGADARTVAASVVKFLKKESYFISPFLIPSSCDGIIPICSPLLPSKWTTIHLTLIAEISPLPSSHYTPILACRFAKKYDLTVLQPSMISSVKVKFNCVSDLSGSRDLLDRLRYDIIAEGWCISKGRTIEMVKNEVQYTIDRVRVQYYHNDTYCNVEGCV